MAATPKNKAAEVMVPTTRDTALEAYPGMVMAIPLATDDDGSGMIAQALMATSWEELNDDQGSLPNAKAMVGVEFRVDSLERREADEPGGIGWYLVITGVNGRTGEVMKWQTSAMSVMAKLVKLSALSVYPAVVVVTEAEKETKAGRKPLDLVIKAATTNGGPGY